MLESKEERRLEHPNTFLLFFVEKYVSISQKNNLLLVVVYIQDVNIYKMVQYVLE